MKVAGGEHGSISRMPNTFPLVLISFFYWMGRQKFQSGNCKHGKKPQDKSDLELTTELSCLV